MILTFTADNNTGQLLHCSCTIILLFSALIEEYLFLFFTEVHISKLKRLKNQWWYYQPGVDKADINFLSHVNEKIPYNALRDVSQYSHRL